MACANPWVWFRLYLVGASPLLRVRRIWIVPGVSQLIIASASSVAFFFMLAYAALVQRRGRRTCIAFVAGWLRVGGFFSDFKTDPVSLPRWRPRACGFRASRVGAGILIGS